MCNLVNCKVSDYQLSEVLYEMERQHAGNQGGMETCLSISVDVLNIVNTSRLLFENKLFRIHSQGQ